MSLDDSLLYRSSRAGRAASATRPHASQAAADREDEECTFRPKIKKLPAAYGALRDADVPVIERMDRWWRDRQNQVKARRESFKGMELDGCTFQPQINQSSRKAMHASRYGDERTAPERLYVEGLIEKDVKAEHMEQIKAEQEEVFLREHTFMPKTNTHRVAAESRFMQKSLNVSQRSTSAPPRSADRAQTPSQEPKATPYVPKTNGLRKNMSTAKAYCSMNVYERLSNMPRGDGDSFNSHGPADMNSVDGHVMDMAEFMSALNGGGDPRDRTHQSFEMASRHSLDSHGASSLNAGSDTKERRNEGQRKFNEFLHRQRVSASRRASKMGRLENQHTPSFKPKICPKSDQMQRSQNRGDFLQRMETEVIRKERRKLQLKSKTKDNECTFKPQLSTKAKMAPSRSTVEMARDSQKLETKRRIMKLKADQEELETMTFQPQLVTSTKHARSKIRVVSEPDTYLHRLQMQLKHREDQRRHVQESKMLEEESECTFTPQTTTCPSYIKRIARSMELAKRPGKHQEQHAPSRNFRF